VKRRSNRRFEGVVKTLLQGIAVSVGALLDIPQFRKDESGWKIGFFDVGKSAFCEIVQEFIENLLFFFPVYEGSFLFVFIGYLFSKYPGDYIEMLGIIEILIFDGDVDFYRQFNLCRIGGNCAGMIPYLYHQMIRKGYFLYETHLCSLTSTLSENPRFYITGVGFGKVIKS
jgi:hypothetical protein